MSITDGFEERVWKEPPFEDRYSAHDVKQLLAHARQLEARNKELVEALKMVKYCSLNPAHTMTKSGLEDCLDDCHKVSTSALAKLIGGEE